MAATTDLHISVNDSPASACFNSTRFQQAPPVTDVFDLFGKPSRVYAGKEPAPVGFRNNHRHIYDSLGLYFIEHHHTRRASEIGIVLSLDNRKKDMTPASIFLGKLRLNGQPISMPCSVRSFIDATRLPFEQWLAGCWRFKTDDLYIHLDASSGEKRKPRNPLDRFVQTMSICLAHDPNSEPAI